MSAGERFLVRHGEYNNKSGDLTQRGLRQAETARDSLARKGLGGVALLLSSDAPRALQTAEIIGRGLSVEVIPSRRIHVAGEYGQFVQSLDAVLNDALTDNGVELAPGQPLVVVAHLPLISIAAGTSIGNGQVVGYEPNSWRNSQFVPGDELILAQKFAENGLEV